MKVHGIKYEDYTVLDFETSGLSSVNSKILQIGLLKVRDGEPQTPISIMVNPNYPEPFGVPGQITEITGITTEQVSAGTSPKNAFQRMFDEIGDDIIWAHNGALFDKLFLEAECFRQYIRPPVNARWYDSAAMFKAWKMGCVHDLETYNTFFAFANFVLSQRIRGLKYNLQFCCNALNIDTSEIQWHDATGDVMATHLVIQKMKTIWEQL